MTLFNPHSPPLSGVFFARAVASPEDGLAAPADKK